MSPPLPTILDIDMYTEKKESPLGWAGARFPLSKFDLTQLARADMRCKPSLCRKKASPKSSPRLHKGATVIHNPRSQGAAISRHSRDQKVPGVSRNMRILSKTSKGWSLLSVNFREIRTNKYIKMPRKGELPDELVDAIWGTHNLRHCQLPGDSLKDMSRKRTSIDPDAEIEKIATQMRRKKQQGGNLKPTESLVDVLLQNWTYFEHAHAKLGKTDKQVHAKYCENEFGHFLLSNGKQIHGQFNVHLHILVKALRKLLTNLRGQILPTYYQELPSWVSPRLEEEPELEVPSMPLMPQLYPIEGLLSIPSETEEGIPNGLESPVFKSPIPKEHPPLLLPEPLKLPALKLPNMPVFAEDESTIDYEAYREEPMPVFVFPPQEALPVWVEPQLAEMPIEPEYLTPQIISPPIFETLPAFRPPLLDPRPCERQYYHLAKDEKGICDGLCSKHGHRHHFFPGQQRREPCFAKPPEPAPLPPPPFPGAEFINVDAVQLPDSSLFSDDQEPSVWVIEKPPFIPVIDDPIPPYEPPTLIPEPVSSPPPPPYLPPWREPPPPPPIGWVHGLRPVFLIECSAAMGDGRMDNAFKCLTALFSPGGQAEVAITHFDIIMYSFDAWSFGDIENSYIYKQAPGARYLRPLEPLRVKNSTTVANALSWMTRWRPAGTTNLSKALDLALSRKTADCIYLFSAGKADKPILILESVKRQAMTQDCCTPIYSVAMNASKLKCRFLKRLSEATRGQFMEYGTQKDVKVQEAREEEVADMLWAQGMIEDEQRRNAQIGQQEDIKDIIKRVSSQYVTIRHAAHLEMHAQKLKEQGTLFEKQLQAVRKENEYIIMQSKEKHEKFVKDIMDRNASRLATAKTQWAMEVENARLQNKKMLEALLKWRADVSRIKLQNEQAYVDAKAQFARDLKEVEHRNAETMAKAQVEHTAEIERLKKNHMDALEEVAKRQKEINEKVAAINRATREEYESRVAAVRQSNLATIARARMLYEEKLENVKIRNARAIQEAQSMFTKRCEEVKIENARKKAVLAERLADIKQRREEAVTAHKLDVARTIAEHEEKIKQYNALNLENEERTRLSWKRACEQIDKRNIEAAKKAMKDFEAEQCRVQEENIKLAERRLDLKRRIAVVMNDNDEIVRRKKIQWKEACVRLEKDHEMAVAKAKEMHKVLVEQVKRRNAEKLQSSLLEHKAKVATVESYNETVRPYVEASNIIRAEIKRIEAFLQCVADGILPQDRHIMEKNLSKSPLDKDLDLLAVSDATLNTELLIEALRCAYGKTWKSQKAGDGRQSKRLGSSGDEAGSRLKLSGLIPIHPARANPHSCTESEETTRLF